MSKNDSPDRTVRLNTENGEKGGHKKTKIGEGKE